MLSFSPPNDDRYEVARQVGTANRATLKQGSRTIATRWQEITKKMLELYQTEDFFSADLYFSLKVIHTNTSTIPQVRASEGLLKDCLE